MQCSPKPGYKRIQLVLRAERQQIFVRVGCRLDFNHPPATRECVKTLILPKLQLGVGSTEFARTV